MAGYPEVQGFAAPFYGALPILAVERLLAGETATVGTFPPESSTICDSFKALKRSGRGVGDLYEEMSGSGKYVFGSRARSVNSAEPYRSGATEMLTAGSVAGQFLTINPLAPTIWQEVPI